MSATTGLARASGHDWAKVARLAAAAAETDPDFFSSSVDELSAVTEAQWREYCRPSGSAAVFMILVDLREVGIVRVTRVDDSRAAITDLWVEPGHRRQGWGAALLRACLDWAGFFKMRTVELWVDARANDARRLYARIGFVAGVDGCAFTYVVPSG